MRLDGNISLHFRIDRYNTQLLLERCVAIHVPVILTNPTTYTSESLDWITTIGRSCIRKWIEKHISEEVMIAIHYSVNLDMKENP